MERVRIDRWLCAARVFRSRSLAQAACAGGKVKLNGDGAGAGPSSPVRPDDEVRVQAPGGLRVLRVLALAEKRLSAPLARELYEDRTPPELKLDPGLGTPVRGRGAGRPSKRERRDLERFKRGR